MGLNFPEPKLNSPLLEIQSFAVWLQPTVSMQKHKMALATVNLRLFIIFG